MSEPPVLSGSDRLLLNSVLETWDDTAGYRIRPVAWAEEVARFKLWSIQREILDALAKHRYVAVHSCHASGKTLDAALAATWWIDAHPLGSAYLVSTAPTQHQISSVLWREMIKIHENADLRGRITRSGYPKWHIGTREVGHGRKPSDHAESTFQGLHEKFILAVIDEAGGISAKLFRDVDTLVTNANGKVLAIGNPDDPSSHFARICEPDSGWHVIHIDGMRTPNITAAAMETHPLIRALMLAEGIPPSTENVTKALRDNLISADWIEERLRWWAGINPDDRWKYDTEEEWNSYVARKAANSQLVQAKVRGVFAPAAQANKVIPLGWVELAIARFRDWDEAGRPEQHGRRIVGVDVARFGEDDTVIAPRQGRISHELRTYAHADTMETVDNVARHLMISQSLAVVDDIGIGAGVIDRLRQMKFRGEINGESEPFTASKNSGRMDASGEYKFANDRAAAWWRMRELLDPSRGSNIALPPDDDLKLELTAPEFTIRTGGIIKVESKDEIKRRLSRSTDRADAVIQSWWIDGIAVNAALEDQIKPANHSDGIWENELMAANIKPSGWTAWDVEEELVSSGWDLDR